MGCDENAAASLGLAEQPCGERRLAIGVDPRVGSSRTRDRARRPIRQRRRVARAPRSRGRADGGTSRSRARTRRVQRRAHLVTADAERDLVQRRLFHEIAARVLREVRRAAGPGREPAVRLEQTRSDLRERRLAAAVAALESDDLARSDARARPRRAPRGHGRTRTWTASSLIDRRAARARCGDGSCGSSPPAYRGAKRREPGTRLGDGRVEDNAALLHHHHSIRNRERAVDPLLGEDDGALRLLDRGEKRLGAFCVELGGRLVEQQELWSQRERRCEADALQLPARELDGAPAREVRGSDLVEGDRDLRPDLLWGDGRCSRDRTRPRCRRASSRPGSPGPGRPTRRCPPVRPDHATACPGRRPRPSRRSGHHGSAARGPPVRAGASTCRCPRARAGPRPRPLRARARRRARPTRRPGRRTRARRPALEPYRHRHDERAPRRSRRGRPTSTAGRGARVVSLRPKPRASIASARPGGPLERPGDERREQHRVAPHPVQLDAAAAHRLGKPAASRSRLGTRRVARATASAERRANPAAETSRS